MNPLPVCNFLLSEQLLNFLNERVARIAPYFEKINLRGYVKVKQRDVKRIMYIFLEKSNEV